MKRCVRAACRQPVPDARACPLCRDCMREYVRERRAKEKKFWAAPADLYCGNCGCKVTATTACCSGAVVVPTIGWSLWHPEQSEIGLTLKAHQGVLSATKLLLKIGGSEDRLLRWGSRLGTVNGALVSPYLYTDNALGLLCFLTPRALAGGY